MQIQVKLFWLVLIALITIAYSFYLIIKLNQLINHVTNSEGYQLQTQKETGKEATA